MERDGRVQSEKGVQRMSQVSRWVYSCRRGKIGWCRTYPRIELSQATMAALIASISVKDTLLRSPPDTPRVRWSPTSVLLVCGIPNASTSRFV